MKGFLVLLLIVIIGVLGYLVFGKDTLQVKSQSEKNVNVGSANAPEGSDEKFAYLASQTSNNCGLQKETVFNYPDDQRIQGSCCDKMDHHAYVEQIEGLKKYKDYSFIPKDPYDISAAEARVTYGFLDGIKLTPEQQTVYNEAMKLSDEGGPCCCKCWHWDVYEGLAKKLIVDYGWNSDQVAELWDLSDACGGAGHEHEA